MPSQVWGAADALIRRTNQFRSIKILQKFFCFTFHGFTFVKSHSKN